MSSHLKWPNPDIHRSYDPYWLYAYHLLYRPPKPLQIVNFGPHAVNLTIRANGLQAGVNTMGSRVTVLTSSNVMNENSFTNPNNVRGWLCRSPGVRSMNLLILAFSVVKHSHLTHLRHATDAGRANHQRSTECCTSDANLAEPLLVHFI